MLALALLAALIASTGRSIDLAHYYSSSAAERAAAAGAAALAERLTSVAPGSLASPARLYSWLVRVDDVERDLQRADLYVYLRSEEDVDDTTDARADEQLGQNFDRTEAARCRLVATIGQRAIESFLIRYAPLRPYRFALDSCLHQERRSGPAAVLARVTAPVLDAMASSYRQLRRSSNDVSSNQSAFAAMLIAIAAARNGAAELRGFESAPDAAYFDRGLPAKTVAQTLALLRNSTVNRDYRELTAGEHDSYTPPLFSVEQAVTEILSAEQAMGPTYAGAYERLFNPASARVDVCTAPRCDRTGFSVGYSGVISGVFLGKFDGSTNGARALAHEAGHAVHRQFMNEGQPIGFYNNGPHFMFESFAIFNELLFLDHLYATAKTSQARAYYLQQFTDDAVFQVYGSAKETALEESIYRGVRAGTIRDAADLDALAEHVFTTYDGKSAPDPDARLYWAHDSLFYTDPLYDVNYLFAGLLALTYFDRFESDPHDFSRRYVSLLRNGFNSDPVTLERQFLGIDLTDVASLVRAANDSIERRMQKLRGLYRPASAVLLRRHAECTAETPSKVTLIRKSAPQSDFTQRNVLAKQRSSMR
jgi:oligoendopeptidase F